MSERPDRRMQTVARRQHGAFSRAQAKAAGFTPRMIDHRVSSGAWLRLDWGVYALASHPFTWERQAMAATLAVGGALLSGRAAAALHRLDGFRRGRLEITVPKNRNGRCGLAKVRHSDFSQATKVHCVPCLTVAHTVLSLAGRGAEELLDRAVDHALAHRVVTIEELQDRFVTWARFRQPGVGSLRTLLMSKGDGFVPPTSQLERMLRSFLTTPGLPPFDYEYELPWWPPGAGRVDACLPGYGVIVEADGRAWHTREHDFQKDRQRDNQATANGFATLRFTYVDLLNYADENLDLLRQTLSRRGFSLSKS